MEAIANQVSYAMKADIEDADFIRSLERGIWMELW